MRLKPVAIEAEAEGAFHVEAPLVFESPPRIDDDKSTFGLMQRRSPSGGTPQEELLHNELSAALDRLGVLPDDLHDV